MIEKKEKSAKSINIVEANDKEMKEKELLFGCVQMGLLGDMTKDDDDDRGSNYWCSIGLKTTTTANEMTAMAQQQQQGQ